MNVSGTGLALAFAVATAANAQFTDWSPPENVGPPVNTTTGEFGPFLSKDGLTLFFGRGGSPTVIDIWVAQRANVDNSWETPQKLGSNVNSAGSIDNNPALSLNEHELYFNSDRPGGFGANDLYVSRRHNKRDPFGWEASVNLGGNVNSPAAETHPTFFEDEQTGVITMYFDSNRPGLGGTDIYASTLLPDGTFSPAVLVEELSTSFDDQQPSVRRDGLEMFLASDRPGAGSVGLLDLMVSTRGSTSDPWSPAMYLGTVVNSPQRDAAPAISFKGTALFFQSNGIRPDATGPCSAVSCVFDIYVTTRSKAKQPDE